MSTLELAVLIGSVLLVAVVWMIPLGGTAAPDAAVTDDQPTASGVASDAQGATPIPVPVVLETASLDGAGAVAPAEVRTPSVTPVAVPFAADLAERIHGSGLPAYSRGTTSSTAKLAMSFDRPGDAPDQFAQNGSGSVTTSATPSTGGGAASQSAYPLAIAIPVALTTVAVARAEPEVAPEPVADTDHGESAAATVAVPVRSTTLPDDSSGRASVTWSPRPTTEESTTSSQPWSGSQSIIAQVSGTDVSAQDDLARRRLLLAGAGLVLAFAVATRR